jgi:imidazole glycerol-phosphate synthase subunit HisF
MPYKRLIARLDIKGENVIKGIQMDGLRVVGSARDMARKYYEQNVDEIVMIDVVASLYGREALAEIIRDVTSECFVPVTVGGGIRSLEDADILFRAGADKIAINTAAHQNPHLISEIAGKYGSQAVTVQVDAIRRPGGYECLVESGRERTGIYVEDWVQRVVEQGAGEIFLTSVDRDGTKTGPELQLASLVAELATVPTVNAGGIGSSEHILRLFSDTHCEGVAIGAALHSDVLTIPQVRSELLTASIVVREASH